MLKFYLSFVFVLEIHMVGILMVQKDDKSQFTYFTQFLIGHLEQLDEYRYLYFL